MAWQTPEARIIMQAQGIHNCFPQIETRFMCLLIFAHQVYPGYPLVLAANRDEFYARETAPSAFWPEHPSVLAGKDLRAGGTWMGVTRQGRFAAITNYRDPAATGEAPCSRGELTLDFLSGSATPPVYLSEVAKRASEYAGFSLLLGDGKYLWHFSNRHTVCGCTPISPQMLRPGIYGLSNAKLNTPWPKVELGKQRLAQLLENAPPTHDALLGLVNDRQQANAEALKLQSMDTEMEQVLSAQFILAGEYGTRSSTTMWTDDAGTINWRELSFDRKGDVSGTVGKRLEATNI
jgi:uncharacterized protein with NRDE domain